MAEFEVHLQLVGTQHFQVQHQSRKNFQPSLTRQQHKPAASSHQPAASPLKNENENRNFADVVFARSSSEVFALGPEGPHR
eukprot:scaffold70281_cov67-Cyclotella_meneghiniana.AAC.4